VTLQWWGLWEESNVMQSIINDFQKTHPLITIEYIKKDPDQYRDKLVARIEKGTGPDIFRYHNTWLPMLSKYLSPLTADAITASEFKQVYYPVMQQDLTHNGAIYGIPLEADTLALFVNIDLFDAAGQAVPTSWDDFTNVAKAITVKTTDGKIKTSGVAMGTYDNIKHAPDILSLLFVQQGIDMKKFTQYSKNAADALTFYGSFATGENSMWNTNLDPSLLAFSRGDVAMYFGYSWDVFSVQKLNKDLKFKIYAVPANQNIKTTIASYWVEGVSAKSTHQKEAMEFMHYLTQKTTAEKFYAATAKSRAFGEPYARKDLRERLRENPLVYPFVQQLDNASSSFFASDTDDGDTGLNTLMNSYLGTAVRAMTANGTSSETAVTNLNNGVTQVLQKYEQ
jgi:multiple sugar transport system substrate-binding protein